MKKKVIGVLLFFSWQFCMVASSVSLPVLSKELDLLLEGLQDLSDDFVDGQLVADASEKKMNLVILPFFNWFSGIKTTNKTQPEALTADQIAEYNRLFTKYTKVYGPDDELYDYYNFGKVFLIFINAANGMKNDLAVLAVKTADDIKVNKLSQSNLQNALAYTSALAAYTDFLEKVPKGFKKPFSLSLSNAYSEVTLCAEKIISFKDQIALSGSQTLLPVPAKSDVEKAMDAIVGTIYSNLSEKSGGDSEDYDKLTSEKVNAYKAQFAIYESKKGSSAKQYVYYKFGSLFLPLLLAKNTFETDLRGMNVIDSNDIQDSKVTSAIKKDAQAFLDTYKVFTAFVTTVSPAIALPVSSRVYKKYDEIVPYANKVLAAASVVKPQPIPAVVPVPADSFILKNFGDSNLNSLSFGDVQTLLSQFAQAYGSSDVFYNEYQMWAAYVPTRYWELQLLAGSEGAANAFTATYLNTFRPTYAKNGTVVQEPYKSQLNEMALEFSITYAIARVEIRNASNNLYS